MARRIEAIEERAERLDLLGREQVAGGLDEPALGELGALGLERVADRVDGLAVVVEPVGRAQAQLGLAGGGLAVEDGAQGITDEVVEAVGAIGGAGDERARAFEVREDGRAGGGLRHVVAEGHLEAGQHRDVEHEPTRVLLERVEDLLDEVVAERVVGAVDGAHAGEGLRPRCRVGSRPWSPRGGCRPASPWCARGWWPRPCQ